MEFLIVLLAVGISTIYLLRRFWSTFTISQENVCGERCAGCSCSQNLQKECGEKRKDISQNIKEK